MSGFEFTAPALPGETSVIERDGFTLTATIHEDQNAGFPWENSDGHGSVSDWRTMDSKRPGELVLDQSHRLARFYDFAEAVKIAKRDGWGAPGDAGMKPAQKAAHAARCDFEFLRGWCREDWRYVGVAVTVERAGVTLTGEFDHAVWGVEDGAVDHLGELADECAVGAVAAALRKLRELTA